MWKLGTVLLFGMFSARFEDVIGLAAAKEAIKEALFLKAH